MCVNIVYVLVFVFVFQGVYAQDLTEQNRELLSEHIGRSFAKELEPLEGVYSLESVIRGIKEYNEGLKKETLIEEEEEFEKVLEIQEALLEKKAEENLKKSENLLQDIAKKTTIQKISDKLYFERLELGEGEVRVEKKHAPLLHYSVITMEQIELINTFASNEPQQISLLEAIPGFREGVVGMLSGERRKIYIHPDLAYKKTGSLSPNTLLVVDVKILSIEPVQSRK